MKLEIELKTSKESAKLTIKDEVRVVSGEKKHITWGYIDGCGVHRMAIRMFDWNNRETGVLTAMAIAYNRLVDEGYKSLAEVLKPSMISYGKSHGF